MTAPPRLLESSQNPAARELLRAGLAERPRPSALRAAALAVGVSSTVVAASTTATAAPGTVTVLATPSLTMVAAKWLAVGTLSGLALAGTASVVSKVASPGATLLTTHSVRQEGAVTQVDGRAVTPGIPATDGEESPARNGPTRSLPVVAAPTKPIAASKAAAPTKEPTTPAAPASASLPAAASLSREIALIDGARRSLAGGDLSGALQRLDDYMGLLRTGTLDREAQLLRIDALSQAGQRAVALSLAERYLDSYPNDPHAPRLRALLIAP